MTKKKKNEKNGRRTPPLNKIARGKDYANEGTATPKIGTTPEQLPPT